MHPYKIRYHFNGIKNIILNKILKLVLQKKEKLFKYNF